MLTVKISGTGSYLPTRVVTNAEMSARIGSTPEWIVSHTGIASRHVAEASESAARRMAIPLEKFYIDPKNVGNTSSASIPLCLDKAVREGSLKPGTRLALAGFGSGLTWAGLLAEWPYL